MSKIIPDAPAWETAVDAAVQEFDYGDQIPRAWLEEAFGIVWPPAMSREEAQRISLDFFASMDRFREALLHRHKRALRSNQRGAWLIVQPGEQHLLALETAQRGIARAIEKAQEIIEETRVDLLSAQESAERARSQAKLGALKLLTRKELSAPPPQGEGGN